MTDSLSVLRPCASESPRCLLGMLGPTPRAADPVSLGCSLRICISGKFPCDDDDASLGHTLRTTELQVVIPHHTHIHTGKWVLPILETWGDLGKRIPVGINDHGENKKIFFLLVVYRDSNAQKLSEVLPFLPDDPLPFS